MLTKEQNELLCRVGPGTPMGGLMRRYWVPAVLSWELSEPDCPPVTIKLLGEELVAFRDTSGKVGVIGARCAHRRAHMFWGRNEENGLRCVYHGWKFDCEGRCVDMPSEPAESNFKDKVRIPAYPTYELGGMIWAYMGTPERKPAPPLFDWAVQPPEHRAMSKVWEECNWLQALEGGFDTVHTAFLHGGRPPGIRYDDTDARGRANNLSTAPYLEVVPTDYGNMSAGTRDMGEEGTNHVRVYHWIMPWTQIRNNGDSPSIAGHMWVPMDDYNTMVYNWSVIPPGERAERARQADKSGRIFRDAENGDMPVWQRDAHMSIGAGNTFVDDVDIKGNFRSLRNADNHYLIDRVVQRTQTYTGIYGTNVQDRAVQESMGPIADRTLERLGTTDRAIIHARRALLQAVQTVMDGGDPPGVAPTYYRVRPYSNVLPKGVHWTEGYKDKLARPEKEDQYIVAAPPS